jgi:pyridoxamine 5'-phosphate oxidase
VSIGGQRRDYLGTPLLESDAHADPMAQFLEWFRAVETLEEEPTAMTLASVGADGQPSARMVLLKGVDARGFVFYTNLESRKGEQLGANPQAAALFHWKSLRRQVRIEGPVEPVSAEEADAYFASRPRASQIGAWASKQSRPLAGRFELERRVGEFGLKFGLGKVPRPPFWSGFRLLPERVEFWQDRPFRLHDRMLYLRKGEGWETQQLYP